MVEHSFRWMLSIEKLCQNILFWNLIHDRMSSVFFFLGGFVHMSIQKLKIFLDIALINSYNEHKINHWNNVLWFFKGAIFVVEQHALVEWIATGISVSKGIKKTPPLQSFPTDMCFQSFLVTLATGWQQFDVFS